MVVTPIGIAVGIGITVVVVHIVALYYLLGTREGAEEAALEGQA